jgi:O-acetyl-ADP-ribose deacetylase (regulator of RNase III)
MSYNEVTGNLITLALDGKFDVIAHGCNCFCQMGAGLAPQMAKHFDADLFPMEHSDRKGDMTKLGNIESQFHYLTGANKGVYIVNCYTQYGFGRNHVEGTDIPLDYSALNLCFKKMNNKFRGMHIGLPQIGCHLAGGDWNVVKDMIQKLFKDCDVTVVIYDGK